MCIRGITAFAFFAALCINPSSAATVQKISGASSSPSSTDKHQVIRCGARLSGPIENGDLVKLKAVVAQLETDSVLCLNSPGGSYNEGLNIAQYLLRSSTSTAVEANANCYSACAIIFMSGNEEHEGFKLTSRRLHILGTLGFHAPYLKPSQGVYSHEQLSAMYQDGLQAMGKLMALDPSRPHDEFFSKNLMVEMLKYGPDQAFLIDTVGKAIAFQVDIVGLKEPHQFNEVTPEMKCQACDNANAGNGSCQMKSQEGMVQLRSKTLRSPDDIAFIKNSFLNYGPEAGGGRCTIVSSFVNGAYGQRNNMYFVISGAAANTRFQPIFFYAPSTPLGTLPANGR